MSAMLNFLRIKNIALIDDLGIDFGPGLNLLTGETGSGKSIIVDSLGALTGDRVSADLVKSGENSAAIEGLFSFDPSDEPIGLLHKAGIEAEGAGGRVELMIRREISVAGRNRIFVNDQLVSAALLKQIGPELVNIHGQGEQTSLFDPKTHLELLDSFAGAEVEREIVASAFAEWSSARDALTEMERGESEKLQLIDVLKFQSDELRLADLKPEEFAELEEEKRRLNNTEKISQLGAEALALLYESDSATVATLEKAARKVEELAEFDSRFAEYNEGVAAAQAVLEDLAFAVRDLVTHVEFSPARLDAIESRLAEITRLSRKYGGTVETALEHLAESERKLDAIENAEAHRAELERTLDEKRAAYLAAAGRLHQTRAKAASKFGKEVESALAAVALENARFEVRVSRGEENDESSFSPAGIDRVEFMFSANAGEAVKPLNRVASGGEASRLMLILKTTSRPASQGSTAVFDEIDAGIGGRVAESVGTKLKGLAKVQQVLCVTHQPQVASQADRHLLVEKSMTRNSTRVEVRELSGPERIEEIARMLAGERVTEAARDNAREMLAAAG